MQLGSSDDSQRRGGCRQIRGAQFRRRNSFGRPHWAAASRRRPRSFDQAAKKNYYSGLSAGLDSDLAVIPTELIGRAGETEGALTSWRETSREHVRLLMRARDLASLMQARFGVRARETFMRKTCLASGRDA